MPTKYDLAIIGSGGGAFAAAIRATTLGKSVVMIERGTLAAPREHRPRAVEGPDRRGRRTALAPTPPTGSRGSRRRRE